MMEELLLDKANKLKNKERLILSQIENINKLIVNISKDSDFIEPKRIPHRSTPGSNAIIKGSYDLDDEFECLIDKKLLVHTLKQQNKIYSSELNLVRYKFKNL